MRKQIWAVLTAIVLVVLSGVVCEVVAGNVPEETIRMERKLLESKIEKGRKLIERESNPNVQEFWAKAIRDVQEKLRQLNSDPDQYFYELSRNSAAAGNSKNRGQCVANCSNQQSTCLSRCNGDGQCSGYCYSAYSTCIAGCN